MFSFLRRTSSKMRDSVEESLDPVDCSDGSGDNPGSTDSALQDAADSKVTGKSPSDYLSELDFGRPQRASADCSGRLSSSSQQPSIPEAHPAGNLPEDHAMRSSDFANRKMATVGMRPSDDSAMAHGNSQGSSNGRRSSGPFERPPSTGRRSSGTLERVSGGVNPGGVGPRRSSGGGARTPRTVRGSSESVAHSERSSGRSSFAMEQEAPPSAAANAADARRSLGGNAKMAADQLARGDVQPPEPLSPEELDELCAQLQVPPAVRPRFLRLATLMPNLPVPMHTLRHMWDLPDLMDAEATARLLEERQIMRVACLADGSAWALVQADHLLNLQAACPLAPDVHAGLLDRYSFGCSTLADVPDDGYFLQAVGHHCMASQQAHLLEACLWRPEWLHSKLRAYGVASIVADFRRYLAAPSANPDVKLLLEAFQMALAAWGARPQAALLRSQMAGRLLVSARHSAPLRAWLDVQQRTAAVLPSELPPGKQLPPDQMPEIACLVPATPSLTQAGGLHRMLLRGHAAALTALLLSPTGIDLVTGDTTGNIRVYDLEIGDCVMQLAPTHAAAINALAITSTGRLLLSASADGSVRIWDLHQNGACIGALKGHIGSVTCVAVEARNYACITGGADGTVRVWSLSSGTCVHVLKRDGIGSIHSVALSPDGRSAVTTAESFAGVWDLTTGECCAVLEGHSSWVVDCRVTPDGKRAITASHDATARVWRLEDGKCLHHLEGHAGRLNAVSLSEDGGTAVTASDDGTARVWRMSDGVCTQVLRGHGGFITSVAVSADGRKAVTTSGDTTSIVWELQTGECLDVLHGHSATVVAAVMTRKSRFAVTASQDATAHVWNLLSDSAELIEAHSCKVTSLVVSPSGRRVASVADDAAMVWDTATGEGAASFQAGSAALRYSCFLEDGKLLTSAGDRQVTTWTVDGSKGPCTVLQAAKGTRVKSFAAAAAGDVTVMTLYDSTIWVCDLAGGGEARLLQERGHATKQRTSGVNAIYLAPDSLHALTVAKDCTGVWWDLKAGTSVQLVGHEDNVSAAALSLDGASAVTISDDGTARHWDLEMGACHGVMRLAPEAPTSVALSPDGCMALVTTSDKAALVFDLGSRRSIARLAGHSAAVNGAAFSADGTLVATCSDDASLRVWQPSTGKLEALFVADTGLTCCTFAEADGKRSLVAGADNGMVHFLPIPLRNLQPAGTGAAGEGL